MAPLLVIVAAMLEFLVLNASFCTSWFHDVGSTPYTLGAVFLNLGYSSLPVPQANMLTSSMNPSAVVVVPGH